MSRAVMRRRVRATPAVAGASRFFRSGTTNAELPRGVTSDHDIRFDEATQTLTGTLWPWTTERVGGARHAAATVRTVSSTGSAGWTQFLGFVSEFAAGAGDWEIRVPSALTMSDQWTAPTGAGMGARRLYVTFSGTLPTADTMPTLAAMGGCSVWTGTTATRPSMVSITGATAPEITLTGIVLRPAGTIEVGIIDYRNLTAPTTLADLPRGLVLDRCWLDGNNRSDIRRGICANGREIAGLETWITDIRSAGSESAAWGGWTGAKWHYRRNVYMEATSIGVLYGGADPVAPNTGTFDPSDHLDVQTACAKRTSWVTAGTLAEQIKNGYEAKNCRRWFIWRGRTVRHVNIGQAHAMLFQNLSDGNTNATANRVEDIVVHVHEFRDVQNGLNLAARVSFAGPTITNPAARLAFVDVLLTGIGYTASGSSGGYAGNPWQLNGDLRDIEIDRWTWTGATNDDGLRVNNPGPDLGVNWRMTNMAGHGTQFGVNGESSVGFGRTGRQALSEMASSFTWDGNAFHAGLLNVPAHQPGLTRYTDAAAMGFNTTTGAISGAAADDGVSGSTPGANLTRLTDAFASMGWALTR